MQNQLDEYKIFIHQTGTGVSGQVVKMNLLL